MPEANVPVGFGTVTGLPKSGDVMLLFLYSITGGISLGLFGFMCIVFSKRPTRNRSAWIFFLISATALATLIALCITTLLLRVQQFKEGICFTPPGIRNKCEAILGPYSINFDYQSTTSRSICQVILIIISDGAICYRAGALTQKKPIRIILGILSMICLCCGILMIFLYIHEFTVSTGNNWTFWEAFERNLSYGFFGWSILCNLAATGVFGFTLWSHRRFIYVELQLLRWARKTTPAQRILLSIIESGVALCTFQVAYLIPLIVWDKDSDPDTNLNTITFLQAIYTGIAGTYPALIFIVANLHSLSHGTSFDATIATIRSGGDSKKWTDTPNERA